MLNTLSAKSETALLSDDRLHCPKHWSSIAAALELISVYFVEVVSTFVQLSIIFHISYKLTRQGQGIKQPRLLLKISTTTSYHAPVSLERSSMIEEVNLRINFLLL